MDFVKPLPDFLVARHERWRDQLGTEVKSRLEQLASDGQAPPAMIVACCDSRVMAADVFGAEAGEIFVHRNIANLVPEYCPDGAHHGTSATIEFAVEVLKVRHLIVMGHHNCGGVRGCLVQCTEAADHKDQPGGFVRRWLEILQPRVPKVLDLKLDEEETLRALEHEAILLSLTNLMTFPFVDKAVRDGRLELHGIWNSIKDGSLEYYDPEGDAFIRM